MGASTSLNPQGLSSPVMGLLYNYIYVTTKKERGWLIWKKGVLHFETKVLRNITSYPPVSTYRYFERSYRHILQSQTVWGDTSVNLYQFTLSKIPLDLIFFNNTAMRTVNSAILLLQVRRFMFLHLRGQQHLCWTRRECSWSKLTGHGVEILQLTSEKTYFELDVILTVHRRWYVEIKCQLDATEVFITDRIACSTCFGHHYTHHQELKSIIQWLLRVVFCAVFFSSSW